MEGSPGARYLRLLAEAVLADSHGGAPFDRVRHAGAALVAVGALDGAIVERIDADLTLAVELRRPHPDRSTLAAVGRHEDRAGPFEAATVSLVARSVATGPNRFEVPEGILTVEHVTFGADGATITETLETRPSDIGPTRRPTVHDPMRPVGGRGRRLRPGPRLVTGPWEHGGAAARPWRAEGPGMPPRARPAGPGPERLHIADDLGTIYRRGPGSGALGAGAWRSVSPLTPVPGAATAWLEVSLGDADPVRLHVTPAGGTARGLRRSRSPAAQWLHRSLHEALAEALESGTDVATDPTSAGADALVALGLLDPTEPMLAQLALLVDGGGEDDGLVPGLASPLAGRDRGPTGARAVLPLARLVELGTHTARLDAAVTGPGGLRLTGRFNPWRPEDAGAWTLTGFDDRHHHYVARATDVRSDPAGADVTWHLWPAPDAAARSLRLALAGGELEASVEIVLRP